MACGEGDGAAGGQARMQYVCKSCRLAVTREDCGGGGEGLIGSFNPSGHLAERARRPPPSYRRRRRRRRPPRPPPTAVRRNYTNISFYINSVYPDSNILYNTRLRGGLCSSSSSRSSRGTAHRSAGDFFPSPPPSGARIWGYTGTPPIAVHLFLFLFTPSI